MLIIAARVVVDVGKLGSSWSNLGHETPMLLRLCGPRRLLPIGVSLMPLTIVNLLFSVKLNPLLKPSPICFNFVSNFSSII